MHWNGSRISPTAVRRAWIVPFCMLIVTAVAVVVSGLRTHTYRAQAVFVVPPDGGPSNRSNTPPTTLAATYTAILPQDDRVVAAVVRATQLTSAQVRARLSASQVGATSAFDLTFTDSSSSTALTGDRAAVAAIVSPVGQLTLPRGSVQLVRAPGTPVKQGTTVPGGPVPVGLVLGFILGIAALVAWNRHDPRAEDPDGVERELGLPVTSLSVTSRPDEVRAVVERWRMVAGGSPQLNIALVAGSPAEVESSGVAATLLSRIASAGETSFLDAGAPGTTNGRELATIQADLTVLVLRVNDSITDARKTMGALARLGAPARWALLVERDS
jgi:hypothetical protein